MMVVRIQVLYLIIIIKSEVWPICHCLGFGHETMACAVCLSIFYNALWFLGIGRNSYHFQRLITILWRAPIAGRLPADGLCKGTYSPWHNQFPFFGRNSRHFQRLLTIPRRALMAGHLPTDGLYKRTYSTWHNWFPFFQDLTAYTEWRRWHSYLAS